MIIIYYYFHRKVHITRQTLELLEDQYFFEPGTEKAKNDPVLIKNGIETFLISPQYYANDSHVSANEQNYVDVLEILVFLLFFP